LRTLVELMGLVHGVFVYSNEKINERLASRVAGAILGKMNNQYWPVKEGYNGRRRLCIWGLLGASQQQEFAVDKEIYFASSIL
jgi:hypothetical protein